MSLASLMLTLENPLEETTVSPVKRGRKPSITDNLDLEMVDEKVFQACLRHSFNGAPFAKIVLTCPTFVRGNDSAQRKIIGDALERLQKLALVKISGVGRDRYVHANNGTSMEHFRIAKGRKEYSTVWIRQGNTEKQKSEVSE